MMGRVERPDVFMGTRKKLMPFCLAACGSVRASTKIQLASVPSVVHVFWPFSTHSSPSRTALVLSAARSEPAFGSL